MGLSVQVFYVSASAGWKLADQAALAVGGFYAAGAEENLGVAVLFGISTFGGRLRAADRPSRRPCETLATQALFDDRPGELYEVE